MQKLIHKFKYESIGALVGIVGGYLYWKYVGCISGTCPIQANWYSMIPYAMVIGILAGGLVRPKKRNKNQS